MSKENVNLAKAPTNEPQINKEQTVSVVKGAGVEPIKVPWHKGMTVTSALEAAKTELKRGETPVIGETMIEDPDKTLVEPDQTIVIDNTPSNG